MAKAGRPSELNDELKTKIKKVVLELKNRPTATEVSQILNIPITTFNDWVYRNYQGFGEYWLSLKHEWKLEQADYNTDEILTMPTADDAKLLKIKADMTKFVQETLGKNHYSKRTETDVTTGGEKIQSNLQPEVEDVLNQAKEKLKENLAK